METSVYNTKGQEKGKINLPEAFETKISGALLHEVVVGLQANKRSGTAATKTRGEVSGGGKKPWKQKGTGNARSGSSRSPLWRKGGIIFGPEPRSYYQSLPAKKRQLSLKMALTAKLSAGELMVLDNIAVDEPKTKKVAEIINNLKLQNKTVLLVVAKLDPKLKLAAKNVKGLVVSEARNLNTYLVLWPNKIVMSQDAVEYFKA
ncbi:MAG TPA: 50S ribosomal protein L4 [Elusimicrobia bacterium]|nr:MAG: 50S ribosomal protein L4 [Elusimicrobia bacterium RIFOXYA12_FULL_49_49]OGS06127.1 MAG: 50S ribosomal protein L4 [Elusimicrobia bacterium RIFOXYA1_FULL_47_7]OGS14589.1 MAG: 50S ribosomal protein L4 [Elusimicrobia bacterium RIFOXYA2_FULL_47_53]OGS25757.1 MAG: 50S ribosomal protein L4 [Elusimicrobia bacterium RIFOXYB12_FULL_50_12]OGS31680.1 MAG: 50S ribosomal protein L4 [Elusimicrobia bacterium RIFOXYB2_FULL_46_23]HBU69798.1 50S ribosomal protein L4 [Elusimicrobiota bacterium]